MQFTIYEKATGLIVKSGHCPDNQVNAQIDDPTTQAVLTGVQGNDFYYKVDLATKQLVAK